ncbi:alginate O-acetyltransferase AlgX-related protein [Teichococcus cervicalis]|uniref:Putative phage virion morphogenesis protein n=1 Tax=Pseudoroseomonas cervicalis ATCC 49957 TaxID=525371 RepID=D5RGR1_9PROT|nr:cell division protein FtsQ [Pseudoroseomonas cervicalis]EFH13508.1 putative phage virion morphogenesis protein [Pseudoroseomonas cervicalis ATCC 49957]
MTEPRWIHRAGLLQGAAAVLLLGLGAWQGIAALSTRQAEARLRPVMTADAFLDGRLTGAVNHVLAHLLPADATLRAAGGLFRWGLFGSGGPQLRVGCDDWLYLTEELRPWPRPEADMRARAEGLARAARALAERNITLLVAVVPDKARRHPEHLCGAPWSAQAQARHDAFMALLQARGLNALSLLPALRGADPAYYRTDTHWNQEGAAAAAAAIAAHLPPGVALAREQRFATTLEDTERNGPGDLLRLMSLDNMPDPFRPRPDREHRATTAALEGSEPAGGGGLLDETPAPEVVLLGSSYSLNGNFLGALQQALDSTVISFAQAGGGFSGAATSYFASEAFRDTPPRLIVWEMPERVVAQPLSEAEQALLRRWD